MTVILAIANHNGGVGKTVTAANVSAGFARAGRRTLAVDCDAQADLTRWLLGRADEDAADLEAIVAGGADPAAAVHSTRVAGLDALPATPRLAHLSRALAADSTLIARALGRLRPRYDAMVLDLPPSLSRLTVSALAAADGIVIPVTASVAGLHGLAGFRDWLASFRTNRSITAPVWGVLLTQADLDPQGRMGTRWAARCATPWPTSGSLGRGCCRCWCPAGSGWTSWCPGGCCWATRRPMPGRAETWSTPTPGWSTTWWSGCPPLGARRRRNRAVSGEHGRAASLRLDASHLCACTFLGVRPPSGRTRSGRDRPQHRLQDRPLMVWEDNIDLGEGIIPIHILNLTCAVHLRQEHGFKRWQISRFKETYPWLIREDGTFAFAALHRLVHVMVQVEEAVIPLDESGTVAFVRLIKPPGVTDHLNP